ncbi:unnamed protein product [Lactuca saligna]|uniref:Protein kinase domain-containing protein n=1 Tax=Lactuca saligna TaxID=75948 RepID=A0AA35Y9K3_LACSI|nr:unnamed protein product [Lactuca saligna]
MKSANILLDDTLEAKICDFGLPRLGPRNQPQTYIRTMPSGTRYYIDPIYNERGRLSKESDIYSFGVVMFEMSSGTMAYEKRFADAKERYLIDIVRSHYDDHKLVGGLDKLMDPFIRGHINMSSFEKFNEVAHECINLDLRKRPTFEVAHECINLDLRKRPTLDRIIKTIGEAMNIKIVALMMMWAGGCSGTNG